MDIDRDWDVSVTDETEILFRNEKYEIGLCTSRGHPEKGSIQVYRLSDPSEKVEDLENADIRELAELLVRYTEASK